MHKYKIVIYGILIKSNYDICKVFNLMTLNEKVLDICKDYMTLTIQENSNQENSKYGIMKVNEKEYYYNIPGCNYIIRENAIDVCSNNISVFLETFLNVPFSIYVLINNLGIILHSSSVFKGNKVYAFSGKKGIGKSSILQTFFKLKDMGYTFYSDDTIRLEMRENNSCYPSIPIIKSFDYDNTNNEEKPFSNSAGKYFIPVEEGFFGNQYFYAYKLHETLFLRDRSSKLHVEKLNNKIMIMLLLCSNISGYNRFPEDLKKECIMKIQSYKVNFDCKLVSFADDKALIEENIRELIKCFECSVI